MILIRLIVVSLAFFGSACKETSFKGQSDSIKEGAADSDGSTPDGSAAGDVEGNQEEKKDPETPVVPSGETPKSSVTEEPGKAGFYTCLHYDKAVTPIRVDVYAVPEAFKKEWEDIRGSSCAKNGGFSDCLPAWRKLEVLGEPRRSQVFQPPNRLTQFCMTHYDVSERRFDEGFPKEDGSGTVIARTEWFAFHSWAYLKVPTTGDYQFTMISDDGSRLSLNDQEILNNDGAHGTAPLDDPANAVGSIKLNAGKHKLRLSYFQGPPFGIALQLYWKTPESQSWTIVPSSAFEYAENF